MVTVSTGQISPVIIVDATGNPVGSWSALMPIPQYAFGAKVLYVDRNSLTAVDVGNAGTDYMNPLATVTAAVALSRDHMGDTILIAANDAWQYAPHNRPLPVHESVVIPITKGGIRIIGCGTNPFGTMWEAGADSEACLTIRAIDVVVENIALVEATHSNTSGIVVEWDGPTKYGENLTVRDCVFYNLDYGISLDYSWYGKFYGNRFDSIDIGAIYNTSVAGDAEYLDIHDNIFDECVLAIALFGSDHNDIRSNRISGDGTGTNNFIDLTGGADNLVSDNFLGCTIAQYDTVCSDATSGAWVNNHCLNGEVTAPPT